MSPPGVRGDDIDGRLQEWRGHTILWAERTSAALMVHRRWSTRIRGTSASRRTCGVAIETDDEGVLVIISLHGPTSLEGEWFGFLSELDTQIAQLAGLGRGDWKLDLDGDSDRLTALEEVLRTWRAIHGSPTFVRPGSTWERLDGFYACGPWAAQFETDEGSHLRFRSDHVPVVALKAGRQPAVRHYADRPRRQRPGWRPAQEGAARASARRFGRILV